MPYTDTLLDLEVRLTDIGIKSKGSNFVKKGSTNMATKQDLEKEVTRLNRKYAKNQKTKFKFIALMVATLLYFL